MEFDPLTIFAVGGVASLIIERFFYYRSKYKTHRGNPKSIDVFYQEFKDFKKTQEKWNDRIEEEIKELEKKK